MSWEPISWPALGERSAVTPSIGGLLYPGKRHVFSGPPESAKTWAAFCLGLEEIRGGGVVLHVDFEMFAYETRERLRQLSATDDELERFLHVEPETPASDLVISELVERWHPTLAIVDAAAGGYGLQGLDDNKRQDAEAFARTMIEPFRVRDIATVVLDHVVKNADTRGQYAIGSERKVGGSDVHLGFEPIVPLGRGRTGLVRIVVHKDRFGYLPRPRAAELELHSDPDANAVTWTFRQADNTKAGGKWQPTILMEKVSRYLATQTEPVSRNTVEKNVTGQGTYVRDAMDALVAEGYAAETPGARKSRELTLLKPFTASDLVATSSDTDPYNDFVSSSVPFKGDEDEDEVSDDELERLRRDHADIAFKGAKRLTHEERDGLRHEIDRRRREQMDAPAEISDELRALFAADEGATR